MFGRRKNPPVPGRVDTLIGRGTRLHGTVEFAGGLHLDGQIEGDVRGGIDGVPATLWIGADARVIGNVEAPNVVINGEVVGEVRSRDRVVLGEKARVTGDLHYGSIEMTLGARIDGKLYPLAASAAEAAARPAAATAEAADFSLQSFDARGSGT
ncbi:MAG: bactofilin family protein [Steroidobacteraceae bacterium]|jgi:cytoskeletal protein CcmA (bactofilin family)